ncbi:MAG TPA: complex I NDUFA9 subunit family protein [Rhizomicrobium sp.]
MHDLVTVFGGSGFLGRHAVRALAKNGWRIRVAVRRPHLANYLVPMGKVGQIQLVKANISNPDSVTPALRGAMAAVNLVGVLQESGRQRFDVLHAQAAGAVARAAKAAGAGAFVHISALGVEANTQSVYARTKLEGERLVREEFPDAAILRPSIVFGPEDNFFNRFAGLARVTPMLPLIGGGRTRFQPVYVSDVAAAIDICLQKPWTAGKSYELGGPAIYSFRQLLELTLCETGRRRWLVPIPFPLATLQARFLQFLPNAPLTLDQVRLLRRDNVVSEDALTLGDLGIEPELLESVLPSYLWRFRPEGQYTVPPERVEA